MAYTINKTNGAVLVTVSDGTINTDTSMTLIGKNYAGYGEFLGENYVHLLESGSNDTSPTNPLTGQLWYDSAAGVLKVYNGALFKNLGAASSDVTEPTGAVVGDLWFDPTNEQLYVYNSTAFILVGPSFTAGSGVSGSIVDTVSDGSTDHIIVKLYVEDTVVGIISNNEEFSPQPVISGFPTVKPGIQLSTIDAGAEPLIFEGTARTALNLVTEAGDPVIVENLLSSVNNDVTTGTLGILNDSGLTVGADQDAQISVDGSNVNITNNAQDGDLILQVNDGGVVTNVITIEGITGSALINALPTVNAGIANKEYVDLSVAGAISGGSLLLSDGSVPLSGSLLPQDDSVQSLGTALLRYATIYATDSYATTFHGESTSAQYADLAERFEADSIMPAGTLVEIGGAKEITLAMTEFSDDVFGVISTKAAYLMNAAAGNNETHPAVALTGRVPVRVIGTVGKGDRLVSAGNGVAKSATPEVLTPYNTIGRALEAKVTTEESLIEVSVRIN